MKDPVDHVLRPCLPWREAAAVTECGFDASKVATLTRDQYFSRLRDLGRQRSAMLTCMTCSETATRWGTWDDDPRRAIDREIIWEGMGGYGRGRDDRGVRLRDELLAIAELIAAHRAEFDSAVALIEQRRAWNERKAEASKGKDPRP